MSREPLSNPPPLCVLHHSPGNKLVIEVFSLWPYGIAAPVNRRAKSIGNATGKCTFPERWTEMKSGRNENPSEECLFRSNEIERDMIERERGDLRDFPPNFSFVAAENGEDGKKERLIGCETANIRAQDCIYNGGKREKTCSSGRLI